MDKGEVLIHGTENLQLQDKVATIRVTKEIEGGYFPETLIEIRYKSEGVTFDYQQDDDGDDDDEIDI